LLKQSKPFLTFSAICVAPLVVLSVLNFRSTLENTETLVRASLNQQLRSIEADFQSQRREREDELKVLATSKALQRLVHLTSRPQSNQKSDGSSVDTLVSTDALHETKTVLTPLLTSEKAYATIACFGTEKSLLFVAEPPQKSPGEIVLSTKDFLPNQIQPDAGIWTVSESNPHCAVAAHSSLGEVLRCSVRIVADEERTDRFGALVADIRLDALVSSAAEKMTSLAQSNSATVVVLNQAGNTIYYPNAALRQQPISNISPGFAPVANAMTAQQSGAQFYESPEGDKWLAVYAPLNLDGLSFAVVRNYSLAASDVRRTGWIRIAIAVFLGMIAATLAAVYYRRNTESIERVTEGVAAIAGGKLDERIELRSSDDIRLLADNVNLMTDQLREQVARESEARQFQSFVKLSAMLTHDLKNAIASLSLIVSNMEQHFDDPEFRGDAMKSLTGASDKLKSLVERLTNPVTTLSGEYKRPQPTDLVALIKRVIPAPESIEEIYGIETKLPASLFALVDAERIEKVVENLMINAFEAMESRGGTLTIEAGHKAGQVFFEISDTGQGMSHRFIEERLFHPFATTKKRGVGLGLYTCREVVRANGGTITVASREGSGTTFRVMLPSAPIEGRQDDAAGGVANSSQTD